MSPIAVDPCLLCGSRVGHPLTVGHRHGIAAPVVCCDSCGLVFQNPVPTDTFLDTFYREHYRDVYSGSSTPTAEFLADQRSHGAEILAFCSPFLAARSRILDVGCGPGATLDAFRDAGHQVSGIEPGPYGAWGAEHLGLDLRSDSLDKVAALGERFDLVILSFVLEHLRDPVGSLRAAREALAHCGHVYVEVPDLVGNAGRLEDYVHVAHISYFTPTTLRAGLARAGLEVKVIDAPGTYSMRVLAGPAEPGDMPAGEDVPNWLAQLASRQRRARVEHALRRAALPALRCAGLMSRAVGMPADAPEQLARRTWRRVRHR